MAKLFTQLPEELFEHQLWINASDRYRLGLIQILRWSSYSDQPKLNRKKGQVEISIREFGRILDVPKSTAEHIVEYWAGLRSRGRARGQALGKDWAILVRQEMRQCLGQKVGQEKPLYNIVLAGYCENSETQAETQSETQVETQSGTQVGQSWDTLPGKTQQMKDEDEKKEDEKDVRLRFSGGGNVDNSQARSQHSPQPPKSSFSQGEQLFSSSSFSSEGASDLASSFEEKLKDHFFVRTSGFRFPNGQSIKDHSLRNWMHRLSQEEMVLVLDWFDAMQANKKAKGEEDLTEAYMQEGITQGWWKIWAKRKFAKEQDLKQAERQRR